MSTMAVERKSFEARLEGAGTLRTLPEVVRKICLMLESRESSSAELGRLISTDQVVTARVLRLVNSSFYGFPNRISTITQALVLLGFNVMKGILLGISVVEEMNRGMKGLWEHSLGCSLAAGLIARKLGEPDPEEAQVAGLLHDLGKVVVALEFEAEYREIQRRVTDDGVGFFEAERAVFGGYSHIDVNEHLARTWNFPERLKVAITRYPDPPAEGAGARLAAIVKLADSLVIAAGFGFSGDGRIPEVSHAELESLGLKREPLAEVVTELIAELDGLDAREFGPADLVGGAR